MPSGMPLQSGATSHLKFECERVRPGAVPSAACKNEAFGLRFLRPERIEPISQEITTRLQKLFSGERVLKS